ncbi:hypothetical protein [Methanolobus sp. WCC5]|uniref:hypothetical protein n=1 Tax=Methanolobus sp. WCC5 TaxID=3125785 RepID=UPI00324B0DE8
MNENRDLNPGTVMLIEIVGAVFCLLGLGWIYSGKGVIGIILLISYWILLFVEVFIIIPLAGVVTLGLGLVFYFFIPIQNIIVGAISGLIVKGNME